MGKRDYTIILLSARNGLRGCDIINLKLTDVGEALKEYILNGRPDSHSEFIFLRALYPYLPFNRTMALSHLWSGYQKKAGIASYTHFHNACLLVFGFFGSE